MADTHNNTLDILKNGIIALLILAVGFLSWELCAKSNPPPDLRGHLVYLVPLQKGTQVMRDGRVRRLVEFGRADAGYALGLEGEVWADFTEE